MRNEYVFTQLTKWANKVLKQDENKDWPCILKFAKNRLPGKGALGYNKKTNTYELSLGVGDLTEHSILKTLFISQKDFVKMDVALFHELAHYDQHTKNDTAQTSVISLIATSNNDDYYDAYRFQFPHEIEAEYSGIASMHKHLKTIFSPEKADALIFAYLDYRTKETQYMISPKEGGFHSMEEVEEAFDTAYKLSLITERKLPDGYLNSSDDVPRLITISDGVMDRNYVPFHSQLLCVKTGEETDLKMASLESHARPELQDAISAMNMDELSPIRIFGIEPPALTNSKKKRLNTGAEDWQEQNIKDFTSAVKSLDQNSNDLTLF